ncbi:MAG: tRNA preQ1(34) S-adenosylmethionine ribosyltransferase-isomerase QueA [Pseudomonadota bacterium]
MRLDAFDFALPEGRIALRPVVPRDAARLLSVRPGSAPEFEDGVVSDLPALLAPGDVLVFNDTRVIPAQFEARRAPRDASPVSAGAPAPGPRIHLQLHQQIGPNCWSAFARPARKLQVGDFLTIAEMTARIARCGEGGEVDIAFELEGDALTAFIAMHGRVPLPPYIASRRPPDAQDKVDYQTVFADKDGAVAAPTAGLHFTPELLERLNARGLDFRFVTLHVGAGTFLPVKTEDVHDHKMLFEHGVISVETADALNAARRAGGRIVAVGTTVVRLLETAAQDDGTIMPCVTDTDLFITPGYRFKAVDRMITNFHLPRSTLVMLVSAFSGLETIKAAYAHAISAGYRFYSYGDACLLAPAGLNR